MGRPGGYLSCWSSSLELRACSPWSGLFPGQLFQRWICWYPVISMTLRWVFWVIHWKWKLEDSFLEIADTSLGTTQSLNQRRKRDSSVSFLVCLFYFGLMYRYKNKTFPDRYFPSAGLWCCTLEQKQSYYWHYIKHLRDNRVKGTFRSSHRNRIYTL